MNRICLPDKWIRIILSKYKPSLPGTACGDCSIDDGSVIRVMLGIRALPFFYLACERYLNIRELRTVKFHCYALFMCLRNMSNPCAKKRIPRIMTVLYNDAARFTFLLGAH